MLFNSLEYAIFLPLVFGLYWMLPHRFRWILLLVSSCIFYMFLIPYYILILLVTILVDYGAGILIERSEGRKRKLYLLISIVVTCLILFFFKYFNFFNSNISRVSEILGLHYPIGMLKIILPIGLSFHTFQSLSYVIEVYRGHQKAERNLGIYSLYVMFFPQLVAGPIERPQNLLFQFRERKVFNLEQGKDGLRQILWGLFKKVAIADSCGRCVDFIYNDYGHLNGVVLFAGMILYSFQIYCDFSGYSDMALGSAKLMGFKLMQNFNYPYFSRSINEFWNRWHISLSTWFKDYVYIPLGGSREGKAKQVRNLLITFGLSGLWHGANWTFVFWGLINAVFMLPKIIFGKSSHRPASAKPSLKALPMILFTFLLASVAWVFFRSPSIDFAFHYLGRMVTDTHSGFAIGDIKSVMIISFALIFILLIIEWTQRTKEHCLEFRQTPAWARWPVYILLLSVTLYLGNFHNPNQFIYFQF